MKRVIIFSVVGALSLVINMAISSMANMLMPALELEYQNGAIFRSWKDPLMFYFWLHPFVITFILMWVWDRVKTLIKSNYMMQKGISFGMIYWAIMLPGLAMSFTSFQISMGLTLVWAASGLAQAVFTGIVLARFQP